MQIDFLLQLFVVPTTLLLLFLSFVWESKSWLNLSIKMLCFLLAVLGIVIEIKLLNIL